MGLAADIAAGMKKPKKKTDEEDGAEGSLEEEASEPEEEAAAEGDTGGEPEPEGEMNDYDKIEDSAVKDIMESKDPATVKAALRDFVKACIDREEE